MENLSKITDPIAPFFDDTTNFHNSTWDDMMLALNMQVLIEGNYMNWIKKGLASGNPPSLCIAKDASYSELYLTTSAAEKIGVFVRDKHESKCAIINRQLTCGLRPNVTLKGISNQPKDDLISVIVICNVSLYTITTLRDCIMNRYKKFIGLIPLNQPEGGIVESHHCERSQEEVGIIKHLELRKRARRPDSPLEESSERSTKLATSIKRRREGESERGKPPIITVPSSPEPPDVEKMTSAWVLLDRGRHLTYDVRRDLLTGRWLNDWEVNALAMMVYREFNVAKPASTIDQTKKRTLNRDMIQPFHVNNNHWVLLSNIGSTMKTDLMMYDSMNGEISSATKRTIRFVYGNDVSVTLVPIKAQPDFSMCGDFVCANMVELAFGYDPRYANFDTTKMRRHLVTCFDMKMVTRYPQL